MENIAELRRQKMVPNNPSPQHHFQPTRPHSKGNTFTFPNGEVYIPRKMQPNSHTNLVKLQQQQEAQQLKIELQNQQSQLVSEIQQSNLLIPKLNPSTSNDTNDSTTLTASTNYSASPSPSRASRTNSSANESSPPSSIDDLTMTPKEPEISIEVSNLDKIDEKLDNEDTNHNNSNNINNIHNNSNNKSHVTNGNKVLDFDDVQTIHQDDKVDGSEVSEDVKLPGVAVTEVGEVGEVSEISQESTIAEDAEAPQTPERTSFNDIDDIPIPPRSAKRLSYISPEIIKEFTASPPPSPVSKPSSQPAESVEPVALEVQPLKSEANPQAAPEANPQAAPAAKPAVSRVASPASPVEPQVPQAKPQVVSQGKSQVTPQPKSSLMNNEIKKQQSIQKPQQPPQDKQQTKQSKLQKKPSIVKRILSVFGKKNKSKQQPRTPANKQPLLPQQRKQVQPVQPTAELEPDANLSKQLTNVSNYSFTEGDENNGLNIGDISDDSFTTDLVLDKLFSKLSGNNRTVTNETSNSKSSNEKDGAIVEPDNQPISTDLEQDEDVPIEFEDLQFIEKMIEFGETSFPDLGATDLGKSERKLQRSKSIERKKSKSSANSSQHSSPLKNNETLANQSSTDNNNNNSSNNSLELIFTNELKQPHPTITITSSILKTSTYPQTNKKSVSFGNQIFINNTYPSQVYDRHSRSLSSYNLSPQMIQQIRYEMNEFKRSMIVHEMSRSNTHYFRA